MENILDKSQSIHDKCAVTSNKLCGICLDDKILTESDFNCIKCTYHICYECVFDLFSHNLSRKKKPICPQ